MILKILSLNLLGAEEILSQIRCKQSKILQHTYDVLQEDEKYTPYLALKTKEGVPFMTIFNAYITMSKLKARELDSNKRYALEILTDRLTSLLTHSHG